MSMVPCGFLKRLLVVLVSKQLELGSGAMALNCV